MSSLTNGTDSFNFTYDVNNVLTAISLPNGLNETYSYDDIYNLTNINTGYSVLDYAHDNTGLITSKTRDGASIAYTYDAIARLTQAGADSYNYEVTGMIAWKPVIELIRNYDKEILNLTLSNEAGVEEILGVTPEHPFWVEGKAWVNASNLVKGMLLTTTDGRTLQVKSQTKDTKKHSTYNFEVADFHTYFVGKSGAWVHNTCPPNLSPPGAGRRGAFREAKRKSGVPVGQQPSAVRKNVDRRGKSQPGRQYDFEVPDSGGGTKTVTIRDDAGGHYYSKGDPQNRGPHFNDPSGGHFDY